MAEIGNGVSEAEKTQKAKRMNKEIMGREERGLGTVG